MKEEINIKNKIAIQETYGDRFQHCRGCGVKNDQGLHLKSYPSEDGESVVCKFLPNKKFTGGVPANLFGGMIAMIFDCHGTASAAYFNHKNKGLDLTYDTIIDRYITARLEVDFKKPVPMNKEITVTSSLEELSQKKAFINMNMKVNGDTKARAKIIAVCIKDNM